VETGSSCETATSAGRRLLPLSGFRHRRCEHRTPILTTSAREATTNHQDSQPFAHRSRKRLSHPLPRPPHPQPPIAPTAPPPPQRRRRRRPGHCRSRGPVPCAIAPRPVRCCRRERWPQSVRVSGPGAVRRGERAEPRRRPGRATPSGRRFHRTRSPRSARRVIRALPGAAAGRARLPRPPLRSRPVRHAGRPAHPFPAWAGKRAW
jgi:hypothetical protein